MCGQGQARLHRLARLELGMVVGTLGGPQGLGMFGLESDARLCVNPPLLMLRRTTLAQLEASWLSPCGPRTVVLQERMEWWVCQGDGSCPCCPFGLSPVSGEVSPSSCPTRQAVSRAAKPSDGAHSSPGAMPVRGKTVLLSLASWILCAVAFWPCGTFYPLPEALAPVYQAGSPHVAVDIVCLHLLSASGQPLLLLSFYLASNSCSS